MEVLVISDDVWHPAEVIEKGLQPLSGQFHLTHVHTAKDILTPEYLRRFQTVMV